MIEGPPGDRWLIKSSLLFSLLSLVRPTIAHMPPTGTKKAFPMELELGIAPSWIMNQDFLATTRA